MKITSSIFGWPAVWNNYSWKSFLLDSSIPTIVSLSLCIIMYQFDINIYVQLKYLLEISISIIPTMVALTLAAYTIMLSFVMGDKIAKVKNTEEGRKLIQDLNSSFAICLLVSTVSIIVLIVVSCIANMNVEVNSPNRVNYPIYFIVCYLLTYSVYILIGVVIDIFNSGQTTLLGDNDNPPKT